MSGAVPAKWSPPKWENWDRPDGPIKQRISALLMSPPRWLLWVVRATRFPWFVVRFVGRYDDVLEVLNRPDVFGVGFAAEIARLNDGASPGTPFLLGIDDRAAHDAQLQQVMGAFRRSDIAERVVPIAAKHARAFMRECAHRSSTVPSRFDAIDRLITRVALAVCAEYFGVPFGNDPRKFAYATFTTSGHLFFIPPIVPDPEVDRATAYFRYFVALAIEDAVANQHDGKAADTVVARLVGQCGRTPQGTLSTTDFARIRAFLMGMIVAFIPNNTLAGGHILDVLLDMPQAFEDAKGAADAGNDALLESVLLEALRFKPIMPGPFRVCRKDYVLAAGTPFAKRIKKGAKVLPLTFAAMFDPHRVDDPNRFDPHRSQSDQLHFGYGMHTCAGLFIARAHLTQTFKALLVRGERLRRAPHTRTQLRGGMPIHLEILVGGP